MSAFKDFLRNKSITEDLNKKEVLEIFNFLEQAIIKVTNMNADFATLHGNFVGQIFIQFNKNLQNSEMEKETESIIEKLEDEYPNYNYSWNRQGEKLIIEIIEITQ